MKKQISKKVVDVLEKFDFTVCSNNQQGNEMVAELEWYSNAGEDFIVTVFHNGTKRVLLMLLQNMQRTLIPMNTPRCGLNIEARAVVLLLSGNSLMTQTT